MKGLGDLKSISSTTAHGSELGWAFIHGISVILGSGVIRMATQSDFSRRFAERPGKQVMGQSFAVLLFSIFAPVFGLLGITAAALKLYENVADLGLWNPPNILALWLDQQNDDHKIRAAALFVALGFLEALSHYILWINVCREVWML